MDVEKQTITDRDAEIRKKKTKKACLIWCIFLPICVVFSVCIVLTMNYYSVTAQYSVATDSVSSDLLDPKTGGLTFNLSLRVASQSDGAKACINPGMYVEVFYRGIWVAASEVVQTQLCAMPRNRAELPVVARATGLPVGQGLDRLAEELKEGMAVFDFILHVPARSYGGDSAIKSWVTDCRGCRVAGNAVLCDSPNQND